MGYICSILVCNTNYLQEGLWKKNSLRWRFVLQTETRPNIFHHFIFVFFISFSYHSSCRKDHFTVLSIKFGANSSNCVLVSLFRDRQRSKPTRPEPHGIPKQWRSCLQTEGNSKLKGYSTFPNQWKNINYYNHDYSIEEYMIAFGRKFKTLFACTCFTYPFWITNKVDIICLLLAFVIVRLSLSLLLLWSSSSSSSGSNYCFFTIPLKFVLIWGIRGKESSLPVFTRLQRKKEKLSLHVRTGNCFKMSTWPEIKERKREREWIITKIKMTIIGKKNLNLVNISSVRNISAIS